MHKFKIDTIFLGLLAHTKLLRFIAWQDNIHSFTLQNKPAYKLDWIKFAKFENITLPFHPQMKGQLFFGEKLLFKSTLQLKNSAHHKSLVNVEKKNKGILH